MNNNNRPMPSLPDADRARKEYKYRHRNDQKRITRDIVVYGVILLLIILCIVGVVKSFRDSLSAYERTVEKLYERCLDEGEVVLSPREADLDESWDEVSEAVYAQIDTGVNAYAKGEITYPQISNVLAAFNKLDNAAEYCESKLSVVTEIEEGRVALETARAAKVNGDMITALEGYLAVSEYDELNYSSALSEARNIEKDYQPSIALAVNSFLAKYEIDEAREYVNTFLSRLSGSEFLTSELERIDEYEKFQTDTVLYTGDVEHVFTHCLIAFPEICYNSPEMTAALDEDCITPSEFMKIFNSLYEKGYILIDINILVKGNEDGSVSLADLYIPKGKKPLVFSIDDVTYDSRKASTGMVDKLIVDANGRVCTYTKHKDGTEVISYENEIFPLLESFVREHPDFTFRGARGTLCHTGFDGLFGYRTQSTPLDGENVDRDTEIEAAKKVAQALREEGWTFASHSYGHANMPDCSYNYIKEDTDNWINEVTPIIGDTKVMVWPYGAHIRSGDSHNYLYNNGFRIFCGVGVPPFLAYEPDGNSVYMDRKSLDGYALRNRREKYMYLFDTEEVWDPLRPKEVTW